MERHRGQDSGGGTWNFGDSGGRLGAAVGPDAGGGERGLSVGLACSPLWGADHKPASEPSCEPKGSSSVGPDDVALVHCL